MNTKQLNKLTMGLAVEDICDANEITYKTVPAFADAYGSAQSHITNIQKLAQNQTQDNSGIAEDKRQARQIMCSTALPVASAVHAYAIKNKNNTLAASVDFSLTDLMSGRDVTSRDNCQNIYDTANANLTALASFGLTAATLTGLKAAIGAYNLLVSKPRDARASGKTTTGQLGTEFDALDEALAIMDDLIPQFAATNQKFVDDYNNARIVVDTAASHTTTTTPPTPTPAPAPQAATKA